MSIPIPVIDKVIDTVGKFIPDKTKKLELKTELESANMRGEFDLALGQMEVNKAEAQHKSVFVAGWRPAVGWIGAFGFGYTMFFGLISTIVQTTTGFVLEPLEPIHYTVLMTILGGMLGLRSWDKRNGVSTEYIPGVPEMEDGDPEKPKKKGFFKKLFSRKKS